jgi:hypothetical protein
VLNNFNLQTPELGQFAKPHVHHTDRPKPAVNPLAGRDYEAEARQVSISQKWNLFPGLL